MSDTESVKWLLPENKHCERCDFGLCSFGSEFPWELRERLLSPRSGVWRHHRMASCSGGSWQNRKQDHHSDIPMVNSDV